MDKNAIGMAWELYNKIVSIKPKTDRRPEILAEALHFIYELHDHEKDLPASEELTEIIDRTFEPTQEFFKKHPGYTRNLGSEFNPIRDVPYAALRLALSNYLREKNNEWSGFPDNVNPYEVAKEAKPMLEVLAQEELYEEPNKLKDALDEIEKLSVEKIVDLLTKPISYEKSDDGKKQFKKIRSMTSQMIATYACKS